jgi:parallel beta-helix repeat protein
MHRNRNLSALLIFLTLILTTILFAFANLASANFYPYPGPDLPHIYILSDGTIYPPTAPVEQTGNIYKLTRDIVLYTVEIQKSNVVLDGAGYTVRGNASWVGYDAGDNGVLLSGCDNVNVTGLNFEDCYAGVRVINSFNVNIFGNSFASSNSKGVALVNTSFCCVSENAFTRLPADFSAVAINVDGTCNTVKNNTVTGSTTGIQVTGSRNTVAGNRVEAPLSVVLDQAQSNIISENTISGPAGQKGGEGIALFARCSDNLVFGNNITGFINNALRFVFDAQNNTVCGNYMADNGFAVVIQEGAVNNRFYGNTFAVDSCNVSIYEVESTFWDNGSIGNYWGNYAGVDSNGDGIGDTAYKLNGYLWDQKADGFVSVPAGQDNYPLMKPCDPTSLTVTPEFPPSLALLTVVAAVIAGSTGLLVYFKQHKNPPA